MTTPPAHPPERSDEAAASPELPASSRDVPAASPEVPASSRDVPAVSSHVGIGGVLGGIAVLVAVVASVVLALLQITVPDALRELVAHNRLDTGTRRLILRVALGATALAGLGLAHFFLTRRSTAAVSLVKAAKVLSPFTLAAFVPALFVRGAWGPFELEYLILLGAFGLLLEQLLVLSLTTLGYHRSFRFGSAAVHPAIVRWAPRVPFLLVCAGVLYYAILISHYTLITHVRMETATPDLGEYDNQFFNSLKGHPFRLPASEGDLRDWSALKFHADFVIYFLLPFYALKPGPETLLIMQSVIVALTAIPIYLFGARRIPRWIAALVALAFLLLPVIERPNFYDFHAVPVGMFFVAWAIDAVDRILHSERPAKRDYAILWSSFVLALSSREDIAFGMIVVSLFLLFYGKRLRLVAGMLGASAAYFVLIKFVIMPRIGVSWYDGVYDDIKAPGFKGYGAVVVSMLTNPLFVLRAMLTGPKLLYLCHMLVPLMFLWVRRPYLLAAAVPSLFFSLMVTNRPPMFQSSFQYCYQWFPYIVMASILALERMRSSPIGPVKQVAAAVALAFTAVGAGYHYGVLLGGNKIIGGFSEKKLVVSKSEQQRYDDLKAITAQIPQEAVVTATSNEGPHVSTRLILYNLGYTFGENPDYVLFQRTLGGAEAKRVVQALESGKYGIADQKGPFVLLKRGARSPKDAGLIARLRRQ